MFDGTDIAKDSSDIILMDNNFASIVTAIKYGRNIFDNLKRFLQFQMSINVTACFITLICSCIGSQTPIKTIQMLWIDLLMDSLACFTLATERPHDAILKRKPTNKNESLINITMIKHILFQSLSLITILIIIYLYGPHFINEHNIMRLTENRLIFRCYGGLPGGIKDTNKIIYGIQTYWSNKYELNKEMASENLCGDYSNIEDLSKAFKFYCRKFGSPVHLTILFNIFVIYTLFNQINCRVLGKKFNIFKRILKNPIFIAVSTIELFAQINIVQFWNVVFKLSYEGLTAVQWYICFALSSFSLFIEVIIKLIPFEKCFSKI
jgi:Ca2+ transporting ATPase